MRSSTERYLLNYASGSRNSPPWRGVQLHGVELWGGAQQVVDRLSRSREGTLAEGMIRTVTCSSSLMSSRCRSRARTVVEPPYPTCNAASWATAVQGGGSSRWRNPLAFDAVGHAVFDLVLPQGRHCLAEERTGVIRGLQDRRDVDDQRHAQGCRVVLQFGEVAEAYRWMLAVLRPDAVGMARPFGEPELRFPPAHGATGVRRLLGRVGPRGRCARTRGRQAALVRGGPPCHTAPCC